MKLLSESQNNFKSASMKGMGGFPEDWYLVNAKPSNWYELVQNKSNLIQIELSSFNDISLYWNINDSSQILLNPKTILDKIYADVVLVDFIRPWLNFEIFQLNWKITGIKKGYYSTGNLSDNNDGILPLITKSMLVGTNISIEGKFAAEDINILSAQKTNENLSLGPFSIKADSLIAKNEGNNASISSNTTQIIGYISQLIPLCPKQEDQISQTL